MSTSHGSFLPGMSRSETQKPHKPAFGVEPLPTAPSSYIGRISMLYLLIGQSSARHRERKHSFPIPGVVFENRR